MNTATNDLPPDDDLPPELAPIEEEPFSDEALAALLDSPDAAHLFPTVAAAAAYSIPDDGQADWALRKLARAKAERGAIDAQHREYLAPIQAWYSRQLAATRVDARIARWEALLEDYALRRREETSEATVWLAAGSISTTASKARPTIADPEAVVAWAQQFYEGDDDLDAVVKVTSAPMIGEIKKRVSLAEKPVSETIVWKLECGHEVTDHGHELSPPEEPRELSLDFSIPCHACGDPIEGVPDRAVVGGEVVIVSRPVVLDAAGEEVPGLEVEPGSVSVKLSPGARR